MTRAGRPSKIEYLDDKTIVIKLNGKRGGDAIASIEDYEKLKGKAWHLDVTGYPTWIPWDHPRRSMHQLVAGVFSPKSGFVIDHINHDRSNNTRENLRVVSRGVNGFHRKTSHKRTGVYFHKASKKFRPYIGSGKDRIWLGYFEKEEDAIKARSVAEKERYGSMGAWRK